MNPRTAVRSLLANPSFTILSVLILAAGIGLNTAIFSAVSAVLLTPLPYNHPDQIVTLWSSWKKTGQISQVSAPDFHDWHDQNTVFAALAYYDYSETAVASESLTEYGHVATVTPEFFAVFGVEPVLGRWVGSGQQKPAEGTAVISYSYWQNRFAGNANVLGKPLRIFNSVITVVGVLPPRFNFPEATDIWIPANTVFPETNARSAHNYLVVGRLRPGIDLNQAQTEMTSISSRLEADNPGTNKGKSAVVIRMLDQVVGNVRLTLYIMLGVAGIVLLIACANVSSLLLAKAISRRNEIAIRVALGASRGRIIRQLIGESVVLALVAGAIGFILAVWGSNTLVALAPRNVPRLAEVRMDGWVLAFTFGVSLVTSLLCGIAPAYQAASRVDLTEALKHSTARAAGGGGATRLHGLLVVAEIALCTTLLAGAGLLIRSFVALQNVELGYRPSHVLIMHASVPSSGLESARKAAGFYKALLPRIAVLPEVLAVGATRLPPGRVGSFGYYSVNKIASEGRPTSSDAVFSVVAPGTFNALGIPLWRGRDFNEADIYDAPFTAIVNSALAHKAFGKEDPIGHTITCGFDSPAPMKIIGVVGDVRQYGPARDPSPEIYLPYQQHPRPATSLNVLVRVASDSGSLTKTLEKVAHDLSPEVAVKFTTMDELLAENKAAPRFRSVLLADFAGIAVCLVVAGIYGVIAYLVGQRSREIGLRIALGATPARVVWLIIGHGLKLAIIGVVLGQAGAVAFTRLFTALLFNVTPTDPTTYIGVTIGLLLVSVAACAVPAWHASRVDPALALRRG